MIPTQPEGKSTQFAESLVNNSPTGGTNRKTPSATLQDRGYKYKDKVPYQYLNGILYNIHSWITWAKDSILDLDTRVTSLSSVDPYVATIQPEDWSKYSDTQWEYRIPSTEHGKTQFSTVKFQTEAGANWYMDAGADIFYERTNDEIVIKIAVLDNDTGNVPARVVIT